MHDSCPFFARDLKCVVVGPARAVDLQLVAFYVSTDLFLFAYLTISFVKMPLFLRSMRTPIPI